MNTSSNTFAKKHHEKNILFILVFNAKHYTYRTCTRPRKETRPVENTKLPQQTNTAKKHNKALLIPLVEGPDYKPVTFRCYSDANQINKQWLQGKNTLNFLEYSHCSNIIIQLPVDVEYAWRLGDILSWDRDQLHASADFTRFGVIKKFLILFIA
jgi:hypothetical protein